MRQSPIELRLAMPADATEIAEVFADTCRYAYQDVLPRSWLARYVPTVQIPRWTSHIGSLPPDHRITVACQAGRIIGFIETNRSSPGGENRTVGNITVDGASSVGEVDYLFVHPRNIGTGIGRLLLNTEEDRFAAMGVDSAILWVFSDNALARAFYERSGWTFTGYEQLDTGLQKTGFSVRECLYRKVFGVPVRIMSPAANEPIRPGQRHVRQRG